MKVAIIGSRGYPVVYGGYETFVKEFVERAANDPSVEIVVYCQKHLFKEKPTYINKIKLIYIPTVKSKSLNQVMHSFLSVLHSIFFEKPDIVLALNLANGPYGILYKFTKIKTFINLDGIEWERPKWKGLGAKYFLFCAKMATKFYDYLINDSEEMRKIYLEKFGRDSVVIEYGANIRYTQDKSLINKWNLQKNGYYLIVGRLIPDNNALFIINEFFQSKSQKKLVIVGDVPYNDDYANNIKKIKDDRIIFTGYITQQDVLAELYHNCYCYLHGHEFGGTNPTLLKALAYGAPVIALNTVFNREVLDNETYGLYFDKINFSLTNLIDKVEKDDKILENLREKSRERIIEKYNWERITNLYLNNFKNI